MTAIRVAPAALDWLRRGRPAHVVHVFERAAYLVDDRGEVLLLAAPPLGMGPFTLLVEPGSVPLGEVMDAGESVRVEAGVLRVGRLAARFSAATPWQPSPDWQRVRSTAARWTAILPLIRDILRQESRGGPFAGLLGGETASSVDSIESRVTRAACAAAAELLAALADAGENGLVRGADALAGLGGGFTPSGDDFMIGAMTALWAQSAPAQAGHRAGEMASAAQGRTTLASQAWLRAAARGEVSEPWHLLLGSLAAGETADLLAAARRIIRTGHTSGEDALSGFVLAAEVLPRPEAGEIDPEGRGPRGTCRHSSSVPPGRAKPRPAHPGDASTRSRHDTIRDP